MTRKMTDRQKRILQSETRSHVLDLKVTLEYSIKLLEDYRGDIKIELKELTATINKSKRKLKNLEEKLNEL